MPTETLLTPSVQELEPTHAINVAINNAAIEHGITLASDRLLQLTGAAEYIEYIKRIDAFYPSEADKPKVVFTDIINDIWAWRTVSSDQFGATAAKLDFSPVIGDIDNVVGEVTSDPEHASQIALMGIRGLQNYLLLVETGVIERPDVLFGITNPEMAIVAERLGLSSDAARANPNHPDVVHKELRQMSEVRVSGSFEEVSERVFSKDIRRLERALERRQSAKK
jgi:hypothetical protein